MFIEIIIALLILVPAFYLALNRSSWLLDYAILVIAFNRLIRRLVDYYVHQDFNPYSLISLTPLVVAGLMLYPALVHYPSLDRVRRVPLYFMALAIGYGFIIGFFQNGIGAVYSLGEWLAGFSAFAFAAALPVDAKVADRWIRSAGWTGMAVAAYGWWQYFTIPVWDAFWVREVGFVGYLGQLRPTEMSVFSSMNSRGPCAAFLAWTAIPMILQSRWRNVTSWGGVLLILSCIMLTMTRTMFIVIVIVAVLTPLLNRGKGMKSILAFAVVLTVAASYGIDKLPGAERIQQRYQTLANITEDGSFQGRLAIYRYGWSDVATNPIGYGLGSSGLAGRVSEASRSIGDSGYVQLFFQFGWLGTLGFFWALYRIWQIASFQARQGNADPFILSSRGILLGTLAFLFVGDIFSGFSLFWVIFGRAVSPYIEESDETDDLTDEEDLAPIDYRPAYRKRPRGSLPLESI